LAFSSLLLILLLFLSLPFPFLLYRFSCLLISSSSWPVTFSHSLTQFHTSQLSRHSLITSTPLLDRIHSIRNRRRLLNSSLLRLTGPGGCARKAFASYSLPLATFCFDRSTAGSRPCCRCLSQSWLKTPSIASKWIVKSGEGDRHRRPFDCNEH